MNHTVRIGAFDLIADDSGSTLLSLRRDLDLRNLPGGGMEAGEAPWETVVRDVREETGLEVVVERLHGVYSKTERDVVSFHFVCEVAAGELHPTDEAREHRYFALNELPQQLSPHSREPIQSYSEGSNLQLKRQDGPSTREWLARQQHGNQSPAILSSANDSADSESGV